MSTFVLMYFLYFCTLDYSYKLPCKIWRLLLKKMSELRVCTEQRTDCEKAAALFLVLLALEEKFL